MFNRTKNNLIEEMCLNINLLIYKYVLYFCIFFFYWVLKKLMPVLYWLSPCFYFTINLTLVPSAPASPSAHMPLAILSYCLDTLASLRNELTLSTLEENILLVSRLNSKKKNTGCPYSRSTRYPCRTVH